MRLKIVLPMLLGVPVAASAHADAAASTLGSVDLLALLALALAAAVYVRALVSRRGLRLQHAAAFGLGWLVLLLAIAPPLDAPAAAFFPLHMVEHELLMLVAPPLLILGRPYAALACVLPRHSSLLTLAAWPLRTPATAAVALHAAALWVWHLPRLFDAGLESEVIHALQHASFFWTALLFWWVVFRRAGNGVAVLCLLAMLIASGALAALLTFARAPLYAGTTLQEQQLGGLVMWVPAGYAMLLAGLLAFHRLLKASPA